MGVQLSFLIANVRLTPTEPSWEVIASVRMSRYTPGRNEGWSWSAFSLVSHGWEGGETASDWLADPVPKELELPPGSFTLFSLPGGVCLLKIRHKASRRGRVWSTSQPLSHAQTPWVRVFRDPFFHPYKDARPDPASHFHYLFQLTMSLELQ